MRYFKIIVVVLLIIVGVIFILQNKDLQRPARIDFRLYLLPQRHVAPAAAPAGEGAASDQAGGAAVETGAAIPIYILIFLAFFCGLVVAFFLALAERYRLKRLVKESLRRTKALETEVHRLRNMPLTQPQEERPLPEPAESASES